MRQCHLNNTHFYYYYYYYCCRVNALSHLSLQYWCLQAEPTSSYTHTRLINESSATLTNWPQPGITQWASWWGRPQRWRVKGRTSTMQSRSEICSRKQKLLLANRVRNIIHSDMIAFIALPVWAEPAKIPHKLNFIWSSSFLRLHPQAEP